jgi:hypothetical protein
VGCIVLASGVYARITWSGQGSSLGLSIPVLHGGVSDVGSGVGLDPSSTVDPALAHTTQTPLGATTFCDMSGIGADR